MRAVVETHQGAYARLERELSGYADVEALLGEIEGGGDATVSLGLSDASEEAEVIVGVTPDGYLLTRFHDGDFEQLVGAPQASGETEVTLGGQPTPTPRRWLVARDDLLRILARYVSEATFPDGVVWERP